MTPEIIKSYLCELGWNVDNEGQRKFEDALRVAKQSVSMFSGEYAEMAKVVVGAGAAVLTTLTAIATGAVAMGLEVANSDLKMQLLARQMFMSLPAMREMTFALDALGVTARDVMWGPPEIARRYRQLVADTRQVMAELGPEDFEHQMFKIRELEFEFTRIKNLLKLTAMGVVQSLSKALTGDESGLQNKLSGWIDKFIKDIPYIANTIATTLAPVIRDVWAIFKDLGHIVVDIVSPGLRLLGLIFGDPKLLSGKVNIENIGLALQHISHTLRQVADVVT